MIYIDTSVIVALLTVESSTKAVTSWFSGIKERPVSSDWLLTSRGRGVAVVQSVSDYEDAEEERTFMRAIVEGLADLDAGREISLSDVKTRLGLK